MKFTDYYIPNLRVTGSNPVGITNFLTMKSGCRWTTASFCKSGPLISKPAVPAQLMSVTIAPTASSLNPKPEKSAGRSCDRHRVLPSDYICGMITLSMT